MQGLRKEDEYNGGPVQEKHVRHLRWATGIRPCVKQSRRPQPPGCPRYGRRGRQTRSGMVLPAPGATQSEFQEMKWA